MSHGPRRILTFERPFPFAVHLDGLALLHCGRGARDGLRPLLVKSAVTVTGESPFGWAPPVH
jgi:hypothetical protein